MTELDKKRSAIRGAKQNSLPNGHSPAAGHLVAPGDKARIESRSLAEVENRDVSWLWPGRIPHGMFTMLDGDPSHGKSLITLDIAARLSRGGPMPLCSGTEIEPTPVLIVAAEDAVGATIKPRAQVAGCDEKLIRVCETIRLGQHERPIRFPDDFDLLEREIAEHRVGLVVIDPLLGFLSQAIDSHKDQSIRDVLHKLKLLAEKTGCAIVGLRHLSKGGSGNALYRGMGSIGIVAAARSALAVDWHPTEEGTRVLATTKCNLAKMPRSITYRIDDAFGHPIIKWGSECDLTAADLGVQLVQGSKGAMEEAKDFLRELLADGPVSANEGLGRAAAAGIRERTLDRAKKALKIETDKLGFDSSIWVWKLPGE